MSRSPTKRILTELSAYNNSPPSPSQTGLVSLVPSPSSLLTLSAILQCPSSSSPSLGYLGGRWLLSITLPPNYPIGAPKIKFVTRICHPNVKWETGEICLDVLGDKWTPVLGVVACDLLSNNFSYPTFPQNNESEIDLPRYQISLEPLKHHLLTSTYLSWRFEFHISDFHVEKSYKRLHYKYREHDGEK
ncbi:hypothetical protein EYC84_002600 [Monilinia fructicola]|uniref:UBC core domain-containing protein n=1 Tax=Monilinia fructicola TaxID=38448 RepID=A0A5M9JPF7_MONFR|nr:hypothetical protein EYC84_002600 [Monilinia fructicola]